MESFKYDLSASRSLFDSLSLEGSRMQKFADRTRMPRGKNSKQNKRLGGLPSSTEPTQDSVRANVVDATASRDPNKADSKGTPTSEKKQLTSPSLITKNLDASSSKGRMSLILEAPASTSLFDCLTLDRGQTWERQQQSRRRPGRKPKVLTESKVTTEYAGVFGGFAEHVSDIDASTVAGFSYDNLSEYGVNSVSSSTSDDEVRSNDAN